MTRRETDSHPCANMPESYMERPRDQRLDAAPKALVRWSYSSAAHGESWRKDIGIVKVTWSPCFCALRSLFSRTPARTSSRRYSSYSLPSCGMNGRASVQGFARVGPMRRPTTGFAVYSARRRALGQASWVRRRLLASARPICRCVWRPFLDTPYWRTICRCWTDSSSTWDREARRVRRGSTSRHGTLWSFAFASFVQVGESRFAILDADREASCCMR